LGLHVLEVGGEQSTLVVDGASNHDEPALEGVSAAGAPLYLVRRIHEFIREDGGANLGSPLCTMSEPHTDPHGDQRSDHWKDAHEAPSDQQQAGRSNGERGEAEPSVSSGFVRGRPRGVR
jgi:hypothetical protein